MDGQQLWESLSLSYHMPNNSTPGIFQRDENLCHRKTYVPEVVRAAIFTIAKKQKQAKCQSTEKQIHKMWYIHPFNEILFDNKKY